jgi:hypothetical protein
VVGFQASRGVLFRFEGEAVEAKTAQQCPDNGRVYSWKRGNERLDARGIPTLDAILQVREGG